MARIATTGNATVRNPNPATGVGRAREGRDDDRADGNRTAALGRPAVAAPEPRSPPPALGAPRCVRDEALEAKPALILSAGQPDPGAFPGRLSPAAEHRVVADVNHYTIVTDQRHATAVADAVREVVERAAPR